uniref:Glutamate-gated chloride channel n=1 Tax=Acrobeloides nanus TaxID=290746 RepID=A0A914CT09_9BILA
MLIHLIFLLNESLVKANTINNNGYEKLLDEQRIIRRLLEGGEDKYDWRVRPRGSLLSANEDQNDQPVQVNVNMSISKVDDVNMEYSLHFTFREEWIDERLLFESDSLSHIVLSAGQKIWLPDTFFQNEKDGKKHDIDTPNILIRVYNGSARILYSCRLTLTLSCPMMLNDYPLDIQNCYIDFASYAYTADDIEYQWKDADPIQIKTGLRQSLPSFVLSDVKTGNCTSVTNTGTYSCLRTIIELKREFSYYLLQLYIPSFMLVMVSWVSFWLDKDSVPARVTLGVTTLLTMTTQASGVNANLPPVSYTKAIDIWIGVCLGIDWCQEEMRRRRNLIIGECESRSNSVLIDNLGVRVMGPARNQLPDENHLSTESLDMTKSKTKFCLWWARLWNIRYREQSRRIDLLSRFLFPLTFILFNISYWVRYLRPYMKVQTAI